MKNFYAIVSIAALLIAFTAVDGIAQRANQPGRVSPNAMVSQNIDTTVVTVEYGRPALKERVIWGGLNPFGEVWRAGANEATTIEFSGDVIIEGQRLPAGKYSLFIIPKKEEWTIIFNKEAKQWGAYKYDAGKDALRVTVKPEKHEHLEWLLFYFNNLSLKSADMVIAWAELAGSVTISIE